MMDDELDGLAGIFAVVAIGIVLVCGGIIIWLIWELWKEAEAHPDEVAQMLRWLMRAVTAPVWLPAWFVLFLTREIVVQDGQTFRSERDMVILWVVVVPGVEALIFMILISFVDPAHALLALLYFGAIVGSHFHLYFNHPPLHPDWPLFLAAEEQLLFDIRSGIAMRRYKFRLWLLLQRQNIQRLFKRGENRDGRRIG